MHFNLIVTNPEQFSVECIVLYIFEDGLGAYATQIDQLSSGFISKLTATGNFSAKLGNSLLLFNVPNISARIVLIGCGKQSSFNYNNDSLSKVIKPIIHLLKSIPCAKITLCIQDLFLHTEVTICAALLQQLVITFEDLLYTADSLKSKKDEPKVQFTQIDVLINAITKNLTSAINSGQIIAQAIKKTKDLANLPANICTPAYLAAYAQNLAQKNLLVKVLGQKELEELKMNSFLAVAAGSPYEPQFIEMQYLGGKTNEAPIVLVGKGITFDTGGNSLKTPGGMEGMKYDMCGAATVINVLEAAYLLQLPLNIIALTPVCENIAGGKALKPDDIIVTMSGLSVEVLNTDAEGRLILCDALTYAERFNPKVVIDVATLTGACIIALGKVASGLFSNNEELVQEIQQAATMSNDKVWRLPIWEEYGKGMESNFADLLNVGGDARSITAAWFLSNFAKKYPWAHLDVAGTANTCVGSNKGATGRPVPLLIQYLFNQAKV